MLEALKCPACSASLEVSKDAGALLRCPYCNTLVARDGTLASEPGAAPQSLPLPSPGLKIGLVIALVMIIALPIAIIAIVRSATRGIQSNIPKFPTIVINKPSTTPTRLVPASKPIPATKPLPPAFARQTMEFGVEGVGPGRFLDAQSIALDGVGHLFTGEFSGGRIQVFDLYGKFLAGWNTNAVKKLVALAADRKGVLYAAVSPQILRFDAMTGKPLGPMDDMNTDVEEFYRDVFVTADGLVYAIGGNSHIVSFDADGKIKTTLRANDKVGEAVALTRLVVQPTGEIYALDPDRGVLKFAPDGRYLNRFGGSSGGGAGSSGGAAGGAGGAKGRLSAPRYLATDTRGRIYVSDQGPSVRVYDADGGFLDTFGPPEGAFGLAITDANEIYASFAGRHVVRKFVLEKK